MYGLGLVSLSREGNYIEAKAGVKFEIPDRAIFASKVINGPYAKGNCDMYRRLNGNK